MPFRETLARRVGPRVRQQMDEVLALSRRLAGQKLGPDAQACVDGIIETASSVAAMLDGARDLRSASAGELDLKIAPLPLRGLLDDIQVRWQFRMRSFGATLLASYDGDPEAMVMADARRLIQLYDGLIAEALAANPRGGVEIAMRVTPQPGGLQIEGRIRGGGDVAWKALSIEDRIRQIEAKLGLEAALSAMLAKQVLESLGGEIDSETASTAVFRLILPRADEAGDAVEEAVSRSFLALVVDDNATNRVVAQTLVEMFGGASEAAEDGVEAVEAAKSGRFDLILMDIKMPRMDGVEATRAIRALPGKAGATPIIALTANAGPEDAQTYLAAGMVDVVEKPMKAEALLAAIQAALDGETGATAKSAAA
jgi:two-component system, sensor histidine kinase